MILLSCLLAFILSTEDCEVSDKAKIVVLYEYDSEYLMKKPMYDKTDVLEKIELSYEGKKKHEFNLRSTTEKVFYNSDKTRSYLEFPDSFTKVILKNSEVSASRVSFMAFEFTFSNPSKQEKYSYKVYRSGSVTGAQFNNESTIYRYHVNELIQSIVAKRLGSISIYTSGSNRDSLLKTANFQLQFFSSYSDCLKNFNEFVEFFNYFKLVENSSELKTPQSGKESTMLISEFKKVLKEKLEFIYDGVTVYNLNLDDDKYKKWLKIQDYMINYIVKRFLAYSTCLPMVLDKVNIKGCLEDIYSIIVEIIKKYYVHENSKMVLYKHYLNELDNSIDELQKRMMDVLLNIEIVNVKYFRKVIGRDLDETIFYKEVEKIINDYYNMTVCIMNQTKKEEITYVKPIVFERTNHRIIKAVKIELEGQFSKITMNSYGGFDIMTNVGVNDCLVHFNKIYLTFDQIVRMKTEKIEITSDFNDNSVEKKHVISVDIKDLIYLHIKGDILEKPSCDNAYCVIS